ncbi:hypothetical protein V2J09_009234 [Rumex salicifolius]
MGLTKELRYDKASLADEHKKIFSSFTYEQKEVYEKIMNVVLALLAAIRAEGEIIFIVASSENIALLIPSGKTVHSRFKLPLQVNKDSTCHISAGIELSELICSTKLIIWDEAPMTNSIDDDTIGDDNDGEAHIEILDVLLVKNHELDLIVAIVKSIYPSILDNQVSPKYFEERGLLTPTHEEVDRVNDIILYLIPVNIGVPIMLLRNIDQSLGLYNKTRLITMQLDKHVIQGRIILGNNIGHTVLISRMLMTRSETLYPFKFQR